MKREIKFRGLRNDGNGWVFGSLIEGFEESVNKNISTIVHQHFDGASMDYPYPSIATFYNEVIPETIGQLLTNLGKNTELYDGDIIKFWYFYNSSMSSEYCFGTEPQNSFRVYEEYLDQTEGTIFIKEGTPFVKYSKKGKMYETPLYILLNELGNEVSDYYLYGYGGSVESFLETFDEDELKGIEPVFFNHEMSEWDDNYGEMSDKFYIYIKNIVDKVSSKIEVIGNIHESEVQDA